LTTDPSAPISAVIDGGTVNNNGALVASQGATLTVQSSVTNSGILKAAGHMILQGAVSGTGSATVTGNGILELNTAFAENISFAAGATGALKLDGASFTGTVHGFGVSDVIDFANITFGSGTTFHYTPNPSNTGGTLTVTDGTHSATVGFFGHYSAADFQDGSDANGGTLIGYAVPIHWANGVSSDFGTASNWTPLDIPGSGNDAVIDAVGTYTVTSSSNETVRNLSTVATATLAIASGSFTVTNQTGMISNAGTITDQASLVIDNGIVKNTGAINLSGGSLDIGDGAYPPAPVPGTVTLEGGGTVMLSGNGSIIGNGTLTNVDNTISGVGNINVSLVNEAGGVINASGSGIQNGNKPLSFYRSGNINNFGMIESTGFGSLDIQEQTDLVNSGTIQAVGTYGFYLSTNSGLINSGIIEAASTSSIVSNIYGPVTNNGTLEVGTGGSILDIHGSVNGTGTAIINAGNLEFDAAVSAGQTVNFSGSGSQPPQLAVGLTLRDAPQFAGTIAGLAPPTPGLYEYIDLTDIHFQPPGAQFKLIYTPNGGNTGGVLMVTDGTNTANINFVGSYSQSNFLAQDDGFGGTLITDPRVSRLAQAMASMGGSSADGPSGLNRQLHEDWHDIFAAGGHGGVAHVH
jgi:hypothetical protein